TTGPHGHHRDAGESALKGGSHQPQLGAEMVEGIGALVEGVGAGVLWTDGRQVAFKTQQALVPRDHLFEGGEIGLELLSFPAAAREGAKCLGDVDSGEVQETTTFGEIRS